MADKSKVLYHILIPFFKIITLALGPSQDIGLHEENTAVEHRTFPRSQEQGQMNVA